MEEQKISSGNEVRSSGALATAPKRSTTPPWQRQPWESATSFSRFTEFYLLQQPPRLLAEAYLLYRCTAGSLQDQKKRIRRAPGVWQNWAYARNYDGVAIPGARTCAERAQRMMQALLFRKVSEETTSEDGMTVISHITYAPAGWNERDIAAAYKTASDLMRRGADLPPSNPPMKDDWREHARRAGFDPDKVKRICWSILSGATFASSA